MNFIRKGVFDETCSSLNVLPNHQISENEFFKMLGEDIFSNEQFCKHLNINPITKFDKFPIRSKTKNSIKKMLHPSTTTETNPSTSIGANNTSSTFQPSSSTPFSPTEHAVQLQYPPSNSVNNSSGTYLINPPESKPAVATSGEPTTAPKADIRDPNSLHLPHLHLPSMFHSKSDPIHVANEYDTEGYKAEKAYLWSCIGSICLCLFGCWCIPWIPFVFVHSKYTNSTSNRARRYSQLAKVTWMVIFVTLLSILLLGVIIAIVVPSVYSGINRKQKL